MGLLVGCLLKIEKQPLPRPSEMPSFSNSFFSYAGLLSKRSTASNDILTTSNIQEPIMPKVLEHQ